MEDPSSAGDRLAETSRGPSEMSLGDAGAAGGCFGSVKRHGADGWATVRRTSPTDRDIRTRAESLAHLLEILVGLPVQETAEPARPDPGRWHRERPLGPVLLVSRLM